MDPWRFAFDGKTKIENGVKYEWCAHHGHKNDKGNQSGMYMEAPHNHPQWIKNKEEKHSAWKAKVAERKKPDGVGNTKSTGKLSLAKSFKSTLTTHAKLSNKEAEFIMDKIERENDGKKGKRVGPDVGSRRMDKLYFCLIPFVYLFQMTFSIYP